MKNLLITVIALFTFQLLSAQKLDITLEDIWKKGTFSQKGVYGLESMKDGEHFTRFESNKDGFEINKYAYKTGEKVQTILNTADVSAANNGEKLEVDAYSFSPDENKILLETEMEPIYRHSTKSEYYIYDLSSKKLIKIPAKAKQSFATFSPTQNKVAYVSENNLYVYDLDANKIIALTKDGKWNFIINGQCDWVYEEEFSFDKAFQWDPSGLYIAYYRFDESKVKEFSMTMYQNQLYPEQYNFKYPKAGEDNSKVDLYIYNLTKEATAKIEIKDSEMEYIPRIKWTQNAGLFSFYTLNRLQNHLKLYTYDVVSNKLNNIWEDKADTYLEINDNLHFLKANKGFICTSERDGFNHIYHFDMTGKLVKQITNGNFEVKEINAFDEKSGLVYYTSNELATIDSDVFSISIKGSGKKRISSQSGHSSIEFSNSLAYYILNHTSAETPASYRLFDKKGKQIRVLEENSALKEKLNGFNLSKKEFFTFKTSENVELNAWMIKPAAFDANKKHPVLMFVYGGPGSNTVQNKWDGANFFWYQHLAQKGYIVVSVDNRGTGGKGKKFRDCTYGQLGNLESKDQIEGANYLSSLNFVDKNRIAIQGWSYGGYMSTLGITKGAEIFKAAIAVAPVGNWRYYDSIYTERYMGLPKDNAKGYDDNSPISHLEKLKGKYLLVHGTADDNVHFQNAVEMAAKLQKTDKAFEMMVYPDKNHGIYGGLTRLHLYRMMTEFLDKNL